MTKLSIIIPVYNGEKFINKLVNSIISLNIGFLNEIELLLINDGSKDNSLEVCKELSNKHSNIRIFNKPNGGIAETRNYGIKRAKGEYITFCDQDDICIKSYESFLAHIEKNNADLLISNYAVIHNYKTEIKKLIKVDRLCGKSLSNEMAIRFLNITPFIGEDNYRNIPLIYPTIWNCIFKVQTIRKNNIEISKFVNFEDDWKFLFEVLLNSEKVYLCSDYYYRWTIRNNSHSHSSLYIPDYIIRRTSFREWYVEKVYSMKLNDKEKKLALLLFDRDTIYSSFSNYKNRPIREYYYWMNKISIPKRRILNMLTLSKTYNESIYLLLYSLHFWITVLLLNKATTTLSKWKNKYNILH